MRFVNQVVRRLALPAGIEFFRGPQAGKNLVQFTEIFMKYLTNHTWYTKNNYGHKLEHDFIRPNQYMQIANLY